MSQDKFLQLISEHKRILYKVAYSYCRQPEDRGDLVQEMIVQCWRSFPQFDQRVLFSTWMYRIAMNVAISHFRREIKQTGNTVSLEEFGFDIAQADEIFNNSSDNMRTLDRLISEMDELNRGLILLFLDGYGNDEIAEMMGISASNVSTRMTRIKQKLQTQFAERT